MFAILTCLKVAVRVETKTGTDWAVVIVSVSVSTQTATLTLGFNGIQSQHKRVEALDIYVGLELLTKTKYDCRNVNYRKETTDNDKNQKYDIKIDWINNERCSVNSKRMFVLCT